MKILAFLFSFYVAIAKKTFIKMGDLIVCNHWKSYVIPDKVTKKKLEQYIAFKLCLATCTATSIGLCIGIILINSKYHISWETTAIYILYVLSIIAILKDMNKQIRKRLQQFDVIEISKDVLKHKLKANKPNFKEFIAILPSLVMHAITCTVLAYIFYNTTGFIYTKTSTRVNAIINGVGQEVVMSDEWYKKNNIDPKKYTVTLETAELQYYPTVTLFTRIEYQLEEQHHYRSGSSSRNDSVFAPNTFEFKKEPPKQLTNTSVTQPD